MRSGHVRSFSTTLPNHRRRTRNSIAALTTAMGAGLFAGSVRAQTVYIYTPDTASSFWTSGTQSGTEWTAGGVVTAPVSSSTATILTFGQTSSGTAAALDGITNVNTYNTAAGTFATVSLNLEGTDTSNTIASVSINGTGTNGIGGSTIDIVTGNNTSYGIFTDANSTSLTYNINANVQLGNNTNINGSGTSTTIFNGVISGGSNLVKYSPNNSIILTGNNTFGNLLTGTNHGLQVQGGIVQIGNGGTSGTPGNQAANGSIGALVDINNVGVLVFDRSDSPTFTNAILLNNGTVTNRGTIDIAAGTAVTLSGPISSSGEALSINGNGSTGTLNLTSTLSNYSSGTQVSAGVVNVSANQSLVTGNWIVGPSSLYTATVNFSSGSVVAGASTSTFRVGYNSASNSGLSVLDSAGTVTNAGILAIDRFATLNISGGTWAQNGSMGLTSEGGSNAILLVGPAGAFTYNGSTPIALTSSNSTGVTLYAQINVSGGTFTTSQPFSEIGGTSNTSNATVILDNGGTVVLSANIASLILTTNTIPIPMELGNGSGGIINTAGFNTSIAQVISNLGTQAGALTLTGAGNLTLAAYNTYTGPTNVSSGILIAGAAFNTTGGAFGLNSAMTIANSATAGVNLAGFNTTIGSLTGGGIAGGNINLSSATLTIGSDNTSPLAYAGAISGTGGLTKIGTGTEILSGSNTYAAATNISAGTLAFTQRVALYNGTATNWTAANIIVNTGATMTLNIGGTGEFISTDLDTLLSLGTSTGGFLSGSTLALDTTNASGGTFNYNTSIPNPGGTNVLNLTKLGANTLTLNGNNSYTGVTTVTAGTLIVTGNDSTATGGWSIIPGNTSTGIAATANVSSGAIVNSIATVAIGSTVTGSSYAATFNVLGTVGNAGALNIQRDGTLNINPGGIWNQTSGIITLYPGPATGYGSALNDYGTFTYTGSSPIAINPSATYPGASKLTIGGLFTTTQGFTATTSTNTGTGTLALAGGTLALNSSGGISIAASPLLVTTTGNSTIDMTASPAINTISSAISGNGALTIQGSGGTLLLSGANTYTAGTIVNSGSLTLASATAYPTNTSLTITSGATVTIANHSTNATFVPIASALTNTGTLDITNNAMVVHNGSIGTISGQIAAAYNNGAWTGNSASGIITSSAAASDTRHLTAVGVATGLSTFEGQTVAASDVLVKFTWYGDATLDGEVDGSDYSRIDNGALNSLTGWYNGDFNYDGVINGSDYTLIDNAFNSQSASLAEEIAGPTAQIAGTSAVPEPAMVSLLGIGAASLLGRRRRSR